MAVDADMQDSIDGFERRHGVAQAGSAVATRAAQRGHGDV